MLQFAFSKLEKLAFLAVNVSETRFQSCFYNHLDFKFYFKIPVIVAVARPVRIATARVAHVPAAQKTAKTVHVPAARSNSTKMEEKKKKILYSIK